MQSVSLKIPILMKQMYMKVNKIKKKMLPSYNNSLIPINKRSIKTTWLHFGKHGQVYSGVFERVKMHRWPRCGRNLGIPICSLSPGAQKIKRGSQCSPVTPPTLTPSTPSNPAGTLHLCLYPHRPLPLQGPGCSCASRCWYWDLEMRGYAEHPGQSPRVRASGPDTLPQTQTCFVLYPPGFCQSSNWQLGGPGAAAPDSCVFSRILYPERSFGPCCCCCHVAAASVCTPPSQSQDCPPCCCPPSLHLNWCPPCWEKLLWKRFLMIWLGQLGLEKEVGETLKEEGTLHLWLLHTHHCWYYSEWGWAGGSPQPHP